MSFAIPTSTVYGAKLGDQGVVVWALQRACNYVLSGVDVPTDGSFGASTKDAVTRLQTELGIAADGVVGPQTQKALAQGLCLAREVEKDLPQHLLFSKVTYESRAVIGAVNWSVAGGVDCGLTQRRVYDADMYDEAIVKRAFDPPYQVGLSATRMRERHDVYLARGVIRKQQTAWRCAVLSHNYPALAERISYVGFVGLSDYWTTAQAWTLQTNPQTGERYYLKFPDGHEVKTPLEWGQRYALGSVEHDEPGQAVKLVSWT